MRARRRGKKLEFRVQQARSACARSAAFNTPLCRRDGTRLILLASKLIVFCANWVYKWKSIRSRRSTATLAKKFIFALLDFSHGSKILIFNVAINNDRDSGIVRSIETRAKSCENRQLFATLTSFEKNGLEIRTNHRPVSQWNKSPVFGNFVEYEIYFRAIADTDQRNTVFVPRVDLRTTYVRLVVLANPFVRATMRRVVTLDASASTRRFHRVASRKKKLGPSGTQATLRVSCVRVTVTAHRLE